MQRYNQQQLCCLFLLKKCFFIYLFTYVLVSTWSSMRHKLCNWCGVSWCTILENVNQFCFFQTFGFAAPILSWICCAYFLMSWIALRLFFDVTNLHFAHAWFSFRIQMNSQLVCGFALLCMSVFLRTHILMLGWFFPNIRIGSCALNILKFLH